MLNHHIFKGVKCKKKHLKLIVSKLAVSIQSSKGEYSSLVFCPCRGMQIFVKMLICAQQNFFFGCMWSVGVQLGELFLFFECMTSGVPKRTFLFLFFECMCGIGAQENLFSFLNFSVMM